MKGNHKCSLWSSSVLTSNALTQIKTRSLSQPWLSRNSLYLPEILLILLGSKACTNTLFYDCPSTAKPQQQSHLPTLWFLPTVTMSPGFPCCHWTFNANDPNGELKITWRFTFSYLANQEQSSVFSSITEEKDEKNSKLVSKY